MIPKVYLPLFPETAYSLQRYCGLLNLPWTIIPAVHTYYFFQCMFPDSQTAQKFACGTTKCSYLICFGLVPYFENEVVDMVTNPESLFVLIRIIQQEHMDFILRFWDEERKRIVG